MISGCCRRGGWVPAPDSRYRRHSIVPNATGSGTHSLAAVVHIASQNVEVHAPAKSGTVLGTTPIVAERAAMVKRTIAAVQVPASMEF